MAQAPERTSESPLSAPNTPLAGPPPPEVPLTDPPLVRVIAQVRFPLIASLEKREFIASFQEAIRGSYPVLRPEESRGVVFGPQGVADARSNTSWRFMEASGAWRVTLAPDFLALDTTRYSSRDDFMRRLEVVLQALKDHVDPKVVDRLGVRYIDRVSGEHLTDLPQLVRTEVAGILGSPLAEHAHQAISENVLVLPENEGQVTVRWGLLPAQSTVDPGGLDPIDEPSWILDTDAFQSFPARGRELSVSSVVEKARGFAERNYSVFRWAVTDEFLRRYGGEP